MRVAGRAQSERAPHPERTDAPTRVVSVVAAAAAAPTPRVARWRRRARTTTRRRRAPCGRSDTRSVGRPVPPLSHVMCAKTPYTGPKRTTVRYHPPPGRCIDPQTTVINTIDRLCEAYSTGYPPPLSTPPHRRPTTTTTTRTWRARLASLKYTHSSLTTMSAIKVRRRRRRRRRAYLRAPSRTAPIAIARDAHRGDAHHRGDARDRDPRSRSRARGRHGTDADARRTTSHRLLNSPA